METSDQDSVVYKPAPANPIAGIGSPPRHVPLSLRLVLLFGGFANQLGWLFFGIGMIVYWAIAGNIDFESVYFWGGVKVVPGTVTECEESSFKTKKRRIYKISYIYTAEGAPRSGVSYAIGGMRDVGSELSIEYPVGRPEMSRVQGGFRKALPIWILFVFVFPIVGFGLFAYGFRQGRGVLRLLVVGSSADGKQAGRERTNVKINNRTVEKFTYEFPASDGNVYHAIAKTHLPEKLAERTQPLLYDPANPGDATLMNHLQYRPEVDDLGQIKPIPTRRAAVVMLVPTLAIVGHGTVAIWRALGAI